jgi:TonB family protein
MSDLWKGCEGQLVDNRFPLRQFLVSTRHSAVFLTELAKPDTRKAVIKFISADILAPEEQLAVWNEARHLDHPNIIRVLDCGRTQVAGLDILYIVTEFADEDLSQLLPKRALTSEETRDLLSSLIRALTYLHDKGLAHCHVKPSNLLAINDQLKLSADTIFPSGYSRKSHRDLDVYDAPENSGEASVMATQPADIWSLGITLVEALTQQAPALPYDDSAELALSATMPAPFLEIARHCLVRDPEERWAIAEIAAHMYPVPTAQATSGTAATIASTQPVARFEARKPAVAQTARSVEAQLSAVVAESAALKASRAARGSLRSIPMSSEGAGRPESVPELPALPPLRAVRAQTQNRNAMPGYLFPIVLLSLLVVGVIVTIPKFFRHVSEISSTASSTGANAAKTSSAPQNAGSERKPAEQPAAVNSTQPAVQPPKRNVESAPPTVASAAAQNAAQDPEFVSANSAKTGAGVAATKSAISSPERGEVLEQMLPQASAKALATIHGTVRVAVRVHVDAAGNVSSAELDSQGPSKYFADLALRAAEQWQFSSPVSEGRSLPSQWMIRFEFTPSGATAIPVQRLQ